MIFRGLKFQRIDEEEEAWWLMLERQERVVMLSAAFGKGRLGDTQTQSASSADHGIEVTIESIKQTSLVFYQDPVYVQRRRTFDEASAFCL